MHTAAVTLLCSAGLSTLSAGDSGGSLSGSTVGWFGLLRVFRRAVSPPRDALACASLYGEALADPTSVGGEGKPAAPSTAASRLARIVLSPGRPPIPKPLPGLCLGDHTSDSFFARGPARVQYLCLSTFRALLGEQFVGPLNLGDRQLSWPSGCSSKIGMTTSRFLMALVISAMVMGPHFAFMVSTSSGILPIIASTFRAQASFGRVEDPGPSANSYLMAPVIVSR